VSLVLMGDAVRHESWHSGAISVAALRAPVVALPQAREGTDATIPHRLVAPRLCARSRRCRGRQRACAARHTRRCRPGLCFPAPAISSDPGGVCRPPRRRLPHSPRGIAQAGRGAARSYRPQPSRDREGGKSATAPRHGGECFALLFRGPHNRPLAQGTYRFVHDRMGSFPLFIVPGTSGPHGLHYEALFNHLSV
jgi:hypothetical protein